MFPKITNYVELLSEDEVWDAVKDGKAIRILILEDIPGYLSFKKYQEGYISGISSIDGLRNLINARKEGHPIIFIVWNNHIVEEKEEESDGESN